MEANGRENAENVGGCLSTDNPTTSEDLNEVSDLSVTTTTPTPTSLLTSITTTSTTTSSDTFYTASVKLDIDEPDTTTSHVRIKQTKDGLFNIKAASFLCLWYMFSAGTLFSNKYILTTLKSDPTLLGFSQILVTTVCGFVQLRLCTVTKRRSSSRRFLFSMFQLGAMRFVTIILGLVALKYVTVSFTETIKSSAPVFTVLIAWLVLGESTQALVICSLLPIMAGLALTSAYDLSFNIIGFLAAMTNNVTDCLQNVYSKLLISAPEYEVQPAELQFNTSLASILLQLPLSLFMIDFPETKKNFSAILALYLLANGIFFHFQSFTAYSLMSFVSPVTHSVANTVKRAMLIWISILLFGNPITFLSGVGMILVTVGVFLYNQAKRYTTSLNNDTDRGGTTTNKI